jgi:hypothetical protein
MQSTTKLTKDPETEPVFREIAEFVDELMITVGYRSAKRLWNAVL